MYSPSSASSDPLPRSPAIDVRDLTTHLAAKGAVMTICHSPCTSYLVGALRWSEDPAPQLLFFAANGDSPADGHALEFDLARVDDGGIHFFQCGERVGTLALIDEADVVDRDDYRVGWSIWQQVSPLKQAYVSAVLDRLESDLSS